MRTTLSMPSHTLPFMITMPPSQPLEWRIICTLASTTRKKLLRSQESLRLELKNELLHSLKERFMILPFPIGAIAQWLEQRTHNPSVAGSSPACPIHKKNREISFCPLDKNGMKNRNFEKEYSKSRRQNFFFII